MRLSKCDFLDKYRFLPQCANSLHQFTILKSYFFSASYCYLSDFHRLLHVTTLQLADFTASPCRSTMPGHWILLVGRGVFCVPGIQ